VIALGWGFSIAAIVWALALPIAAFAAGLPGSADIAHWFAFVVYAGGSLICHQRPERSFHLFGLPMAVCARCVGLYVGAAIVAACWCLPRMDRDPGLLLPSQARMVLMAATLPTLVTLAWEWTAGPTPSNWVRAATGLVLGGAIAWIVCSACREGRLRVVG
jgi:uncharacterized membrane protein